MTLRVRLVRWVLANTFLAGISFLCAGGVNQPTLRLYLVAFGLMDFISILVINPALARERSAASLRRRRSSSSPGCERFVLGDGRFRGPRCGKASLDIPISQTNAAWRHSSYLLRPTLFKSGRWP